MDKVLSDESRSKAPSFSNMDDSNAGATHARLPGLDISFPMPKFDELLRQIEQQNRESVQRVSNSLDAGSLRSQRNSSDIDSKTKEKSAEEKSAENNLPAKNSLGTNQEQTQVSSQIRTATGYWQKTDAGWQSTDKAGRPREQSFNTAEISSVEDLKNGSVRLKLKDGQSFTERNDGATLHHNSDGKLADIKYPDSSTRKFEWDGSQIKKMIQPDGKTSEHISINGKYEDQWKLADGSVWNGKIEVNEKNGDCKISSPSWPESGSSTTVHTDGSKEEIRKDGTRTVKHANGDQVEFDSSGHASCLTTADGVKREFGAWSLDLTSGKEQLSSIKVTLPKSTQPSEWTCKDNKWQAAGTEPGLFSFNVNPSTGEYSFRDNDSNELKRFIPGKVKETSAEFGSEQLIRSESGSKSTLRNESGSFSVETEKALATKIVENGRERYITRDDKGQVTELRDTTSNTVWKQNEKAEWVASALNPKEPFSKPDDAPALSKLVVDSLGLCAFIGADGGTKKLEMDGKLSTLSESEKLRAKLNASDNLQPEGKQRLSESAKMLENRTDISQSEKSQSIAEISKLINSNEKSSYSQVDREVMAAQTLWHLARPTRQEQGQHPTCNVTTIRSSLMHESPSQFARMISEIGRSDKFKTADGSLIDIPASMVKAQGPELQFPPTGGSRSWLGHISDVAMANVYWQRQTVDTYGQTVPKGSLKYTEIEPQYNGDNGERLHKYNPDGTVSYELREKGQNVLARTPELYPADILEVMSQITGKSEKGRVIANKSQYPNVGAGVAVVENQQGFDKEMTQGPWPKIITVHTSRDPFWQDSGYGTAGGAGGRTGGWHVVVATSFDKKSGKIAIDNSWQPERDRNGASRQVSAKSLYEATIGQQL